MDKYFQIYKQIEKKMGSSENILIITHKNPDGDALGSTCALLCWLESMGKKAEAFAAFGCSPIFDYLPGVENISSDGKYLKIENFDLVFFLDFGDLKQSAMEDVLKGIKAPIINIDHHITNRETADINLVARGASSTCEVIYEMLKTLRVPIDKDIATCLLTGILTDTGNFSNPATSISSLEAASDLLSKGAKLKKINKQTWKNKSLTGLRLWGKIFSRTNINREFNIATTVITLQDLEEFDVDGDAIDGIANFLNNLSDVDMIMVIKEEKDSVKASLRTVNDDLDLSRFAKFFGGGGHRKAAGFTLKQACLQKNNGQYRII